MWGLFVYTLFYEKLVQAVSSIPHETLEPPAVACFLSLFSYLGSCSLWSHFTNWSTFQTVSTFENSCSSLKLSTDRFLNFVKCRQTGPYCTVTTQKMHTKLTFGTKHKTQTRNNVQWWKSVLLVKNSCLRFECGVPLTATTWHFTVTNTGSQHAYRATSYAYSYIFCVLQENTEFWIGCVNIDLSCKIHYHKWEGVSQYELHAHSSKYILCNSH
jgi:hypothetical protein